jgi:formylglycine-generating enzyme required for sulfatase activity
MRRAVLVLLVVVAGAMVGAVGQSSPEGSQTPSTIVVMEVEIPPAASFEAQRDLVDRVADILARRLDDYGVADARVSQTQSNRIEVTLPGSSYSAELVELLIQTGSLEFQRVVQVGESPTDDLSPSSSSQELLHTRSGLPIVVDREVLLTGAALSNATVRTSSDVREVGKLQVGLTFSQEGAEQFASVVRELGAGQMLAIVLDDVVQSYPVLQESIVTAAREGWRNVQNSTTISGGNMGEEEAKRLAANLRGGALPVPVRVVEVIGLPTTPMTSVPPTATLATPAPAPSPPEMVLIPAGSFQMGDSFGEGWPDESPVQTVSVSAFWMDTVEVTKGLWDEVATWAVANGYDLGPGDGDGKASDHPVYNVTWYEAVKWANARSEKEGLEPCYTVDGIVYRTEESDSPDCNWSASGYRLPTEAEWEKAARGGVEGHRFPWSDVDTIDHTRANYYSYSRYSYDTSPTRSAHPTYATGDSPFTSPVGSFAPNGYGLYDMAGNVWEWCWDWYGADLPGVVDPRGPASGSGRAIRGGSWSSNASSCRVANRYSVWPDGVHDALGFRLVRTAP